MVSRNVSPITIDGEIVGVTEIDSTAVSEVGISVHAATNAALATKNPGRAAHLGKITGTDLRAALRG